MVDTVMGGGEAPKDDPAAKGTTENAAGTTENKPADKPADDPKADDKKAGGEGAADKSKDAEGDKEKKGAPEKYEFKVPEGVQLDETLVGEFTPIAKELNLDNAQAQKLVDLYTKTRAADTQKLYDAWAQTHEKWVGEAKADKEIGGANFDANVAIAKKAMNAAQLGGGAALVEALNVTGAGNHPEIIRFFYKVGKLMADDKFDTGKGQSSTSEDKAAALYPSMKNP